MSNSVLSAYGKLFAGVAILIASTSCQARGRPSQPGAVRTPVRASSVPRGSCNAQGLNNVVSCQITPGGAQITFGSVSVDPPQAGVFLFSGDASGLPDPPHIDPNNMSTKMERCTTWSDWLYGHKDLYPVTPTVRISLTATTGGVSSVDRAEVKVYDKRTIPRHVFIGCRYGAGGVGGFYGDVDSSTNIASIHIEDLDKGTEQDLTMPPASVVLDNAGRQSGALGIKSDPAYLYSGQLRIYISTNGKKDVVKIGTPERPLRWTSVSSPEGLYGWDATKSKWEFGYCPLPNCHPLD